MEFKTVPSAIQLDGAFDNGFVEAREYRAFRRYIKDAIRGRESDSEVMAEIDRSNSELIDCKAVRPGNVHVNEVLQNLSVRYSNSELIADQICPVVFTGGSLSGTYFTYDKDDRLSYPDDSAADRTDLAELNEGRSTSTYALKSYGFKEIVDQLTIQNQSSVLDELMDATENVLYAMKFKREQRVVTLFQTASNYGTSTTISSGTSRWDNTFANGVYTTGDPLGVVTTAKDSLWTGNNSGRIIGITSLAVFNVLRRHTQLVEAVKYGGGPQAPAVVTKQAIAQYLGLDEILIGAARYNTAQEGQTASYGRMWGNHFSVVRVSDTPSRRSASFAYTFQDAPTTSDQMWDPQKFTKGGYVCRSSHCDQSKVIAPLAGYHIVTPTA